MKNKPKVSVITVVFNGEQFLESTILSVLNQTYDNVEYIIIDGESTDGTVDIIKKYEEEIDYWVSEKDAGIYDAMNKGIDIASGEWINFMNAGDTFYNNSILEDVFEVSDFEGIDIVYGHVNHICKGYSYLKKSVSIKNIEYKIPFCHQSSFVSSEYHKKNKFSLKHKLIDDYVFFYDAYKNKRRFKQIDLIVSKFLRNGISTGNKTKCSIDKLRFWKQRKVLSPIKTIFFLLSVVKIFIDKTLPQRVFKIIIK